MGIQIFENFEKFFSSLHDNFCIFLYEHIHKTLELSCYTSEETIPRISVQVEDGIPDSINWVEKVPFFFIL